MRKHTPPVPSTPFMNVRDAARATGFRNTTCAKSLLKAPFLTSRVAGAS